MLSCFKVLHYYHLFLCRANAAWDMQWRNRQKWNDQEHHVKASFFHLADKKCLLHFLLLVMFCFFLKKCLLHILLLVMLFAHVVKRSNSRSQIFFKTGVLKNFAILIGKHLCWSRFLKKFQYWRPAFLFKNRLQHYRFYVNIAKFLRTTFL